jgi:hypothetical protein
LPAGLKDDIDFVTFIEIAFPFDVSVIEVPRVNMRCYILKIRKGEDRTAMNIQAYAQDENQGDFWLN